MHPSSGQKNSSVVDLASDDLCVGNTTSGLVDRDLGEVNLSDNKSQSVEDGLGSGGSLLSVNLLSWTVLPGPIP